MKAGSKLTLIVRGLKKDRKDLRTDAMEIDACWLPVWGKYTHRHTDTQTHTQTHTPSFSWNKGMKYRSFELEWVSV